MRDTPIQSRYDLRVSVLDNGTAHAMLHDLRVNPDRDESEVIALADHIELLYKEQTRLNQELRDAQTMI